MVLHLSGIFDLAIRDAAKYLLLLASDRLGIESPAIYTVDSSITLASRTFDLLLIPGTEVKIDNRACRHVQGRTAKRI